MTKTNTTTDDVIFYTTTPTIIDRIKGRFELRRYMECFKAESAQRIARYQKKHAYTQIIAERRVL